MPVRRAACAATAAAVVAGLAGAAAGAPSARPHVTPLATPLAASLDFGDAPDGVLARYAEKPRVKGKFPSRAKSGGPRHPASGPRLGTGWSGEPDSRQVDADADDGVSLNPRSCALSTLNVVVDASGVDPATPMYVNAWFDWNQDGDWADGGTRRCRPEWAIQNIVIDPASLGADRIALLTLRFRAGPVPNEFWWRVQLHSGEPIPHRGSAGQMTPSRGGETEDWFFSRIPPLRAPKPHFGCRPAYDVRPHGDSPTFLFKFVGVGGATLSARRVRHRLTGALDGVSVLERREQVPHREWILILKSSSVHKRNPERQDVRVHLDVEALVNGRKREFTDNCRLAIFHIIRIAPPVDPPKTYTPVPKGSGGGNVTPQSAKCRARFVRSGASATVDVRCLGADAKLFSVDSGNGRKIDSYRTRGATQSCSAVSERRVLRCLVRLPSKGRFAGITYNANPPYDRGTGHVVIHVLAGGRGREGTTIVLRQSWFIFGDGRIECRQYVPSYGSCPPL